MKISELAEKHLSQALTSRPPDTKPPCRELLEAAQKRGPAPPLGYHDPAMDLQAAIRQRAVEVGFDLVGIAPATPGRDLDFAKEWLGRGYGGEMRYLANSKRFDPRSVLPSVRSVVCVGMIYNTPFPNSTEVGQAEVRSQESEEHERAGRLTIESRKRLTVGSKPPPLTSHPSPSGRGWTRPAGTGEGSAGRDSNFESLVSESAEPRAWISRYAWGRDYHKVMRGKLEKLPAEIEELAPGIETRVYVDIGPVIERAFARFSGIGWMGKNTCIINEEKGSWFFLGVVLTNLALEPDLPAPDRCGSCRACLDACPTGALVEPYVMNASRCISYLTIELKGSIPRELRPGIGVNIFGCDICQDVCPWNSRQWSVVSGQLKSFEPMAVSYQPSVVGRQQPAVRSQLSDGGRGASIQNPKSKIPNPAPSTFSLFNPPLEALAAMTEADFRRAFVHSPIKRTKYRGWLRNLCVAMGNSGDTRFVPKLQELSEHLDPIVREHAEWALEQLRQA